MLDLGSDPLQPQYVEKMAQCGWGIGRRGGIHFQGCLKVLRVDAILVDFQGQLLMGQFWGPQEEKTGSSDWTSNVVVTNRWRPSHAHVDVPI